MGDSYGGSIENRSRLLFEVLDVLSKVFHATRVAIRLSPHTGSGTFGVKDPNPDALYSYVIGKLNSRPQLAYLLMTELRWASGSEKKTDNKLSVYVQNGAKYRPLYQGVL